MMRILAITSFNDKSEIALYEGLSNAGIQIEVICAPTAQERERFLHAGITVTDMIIKNRLDLYAAWKIRQKLYKTPYDIIYAPGNSSLSVSLIASLGINIKIIAYRGTIGHISHFDPASWLTYLNPRVDKIVCVSNATRNYLLNMKLPPSRLVTIYKGHDVSWYAKHEIKSLNEFGIPGNAFVVGFTGNIRSVKGIDVLLQSISYLPDSAHIHFLLIGEIKDKKISKLIRRNKIEQCVHFTGFRKDAVELIGECDIFVMPSIAREGLPRSVIEAMSQSKPVIVTNVGGMPEMLKHNESGLIIPPCNPKALADAILKFINNPELCRQFGKKAKQYVETYFNIQSTIRQMLNLLNDIIPDCAFKKCKNDK